MKQKMFFYISIVLILLLIIFSIIFGYWIFSDLEYPTINYYINFIFPLIMLVIYIIMLVLTFKKKNNIFAKISGFISFGILFPLIILFVIGGFIVESTFPSYSMTTNISNYGNYDRCVYDDKIDIFPELVTDNMENVMFSYKLQWMLDYAYEVYFEFTIEDDKVFSSYIIESIDKIKSIYPDSILKISDYDSSYMELVVNNELRFNNSEYETYIDNSYVKKFMYNTSTHTIIFVTIYV